MILVDAVYINNGGGKVLLDYLIQYLEKSGKKIFYLLDSRYHFRQVTSNKVQFVEAGYLNRRDFYKKNRNAFSTVLCFGNLPPNIRIEAAVYTYFHQLMFLRIPTDISFPARFKFWVKSRVLNSIKNNTDFWLVQSDMMCRGLGSKYNIASEKILLMPFYPPFSECDKKPERKRFSYLYASHATAHKNHMRLIEAFCKFYDKNHVGELILTVQPQFSSVVELIKQKTFLGYPILNVGFISRDELHELYLSTEYLVFPSLAESFGLALVEGIENGCKIIGADLPYTYEVCIPSITFDPLNHDSFIQAFEKSLGNDVVVSKQVITNKIEELLNLLK